MALLSPEFDCDRTFGDEKYCFYHPLIIGDFVVTIWSRMKCEAGMWLERTTNSSYSQPGFHERSFSLLVYQNGNFVQWNKLLGDSHRAHFQWANKLIHSNTKTEATFSKLEIDEILRVLNTQQAC
eukprot:TRINITY_DN23976_c0_g1_i1.p1 TRINITY_DN23976_c0_g1~~TRINITY_DN23976_c0_g1_i1.p1  ORF type:complete len:125 (+),score=10.25 TRINITY_DN23976_c0_g1_i1:179-553(+)